MKPINANTLKRTYDKAYHGTEKYAKMIEEVRGKLTNNIILDFDSKKSCSQGYNTMYQHMKRNGITGVFIAMRNDDYCQVYRLVISHDRKRRDLLERPDDACRKG